jgi:hypothetical protein
LNCQHHLQELGKESAINADLKQVLLAFSVGGLREAATSSTLSLYQKDHKITKRLSHLKHTFNVLQRNQDILAGTTFIQL